MRLRSCTGFVRARKIFRLLSFDEHSRGLLVRQVRQQSIANAPDTVPATTGRTDRE